MALLSQHVPSLAVSAAIFGYILRVGMQRPVRRGVGQIEEKGAIIVGGVGDKIDGVISNRVGEVKVFAWSPVVVIQGELEFTPL